MGGSRRRSRKIQIMNDTADLRAQDAQRFVDAVSFGMFADQLFIEACRSHGLHPARCYDESPLLSLATASVTKHQKH